MVFIQLKETFDKQPPVCGEEALPPILYPRPVPALMSIQLHTATHVYMC